MNTTVQGIIRRIAYNPFPSSALNSSPTVVFYLEGDTTRYVVSSIAKGFAEAVLLSEKGDRIEAHLRKPDNRFATGLLVETWVNHSFEMEQAVLSDAAAAQKPGAPLELTNPAGAEALDATSVLYSETFRGVRYCFTSDSDLERARAVDELTAFDVSNFEDELDTAGIKWSIKANPAD